MKKMFCKPGSVVSQPGTQPAKPATKVTEGDRVTVRHGGRERRLEVVRVIEKRRVGAGASGGFLGSLMPHMPDRWNAKKQMQYEALYSIGGAIAALEADTGLKCGFRRCGRMLPLKHGHMSAHLAARSEGARVHWVDETGAALFTMEHVAPEELAKRFRGGKGAASGKKKGESGGDGATSTAPDSPGAAAGGAGEA